ncbi:uncharacterized protein Bfra_006569 [Botrytis fragariae]|uniref:Uncharacterized protein n=1 Tax=Botrytis fragariae TaxID=1964551 RepID=A0A8H6EPF0_9HELO|nr:uncharacterized protein Bfra_006569 [Botrytis fragariae]KAF5879360.1 hypothetical protein Bfra_006569 [Botrytis fragariae]
MFYPPERTYRKPENQSNGCGVKDKSSDGIVVSYPKSSENPGDNGNAVMNRTHIQKPHPQYHRVELMN